YRALFEYKQERGDDISLQPGDLLTVSKMALLTSDYQEGDEKCPKGWLHGTNERTKEKGNFPGTFVEEALAETCAANTCRAPAPRSHCFR
ncbi:hypothetical protein M9458_013897, partial [Cirrhinus mrigala]